MLKQWKIAVVSVLVSAMGFATSALAADTTVTLSVPGMSCSTCPITVKKALQKVPGVQQVTATLEPKEAVVTFDDSQTTLEQLRAATANAGYPSRLKESQ
jgi:mercuric ion binding protein